MRNAETTTDDHDIVTARPAESSGPEFDEAPVDDHLNNDASRPRVPPRRIVRLALWILHCWVFDRFAVTPRLALISPVRGCGKTITLSFIELLIPEGSRTDNTAATAIYYALDRRQRTVLLVDEADGLDLSRKNVLRSLFNSGHRQGGSINRFVGGRPQRYRTFAPLAVAAIGMLPLPFTVLS
jgi:hypothetical protein